MKVNVAVCGKFHYTNYVKHLSQKGMLNQFFYSHKKSTTASTLGVQQEQAQNIWVKEYLLHAHLKLLKERWANSMFPKYQRLWEKQVMKQWKDADIFHVMSQGTALELIDHAHARNAIVVGEPVNSHPAQVVKILNEEYERLGIDKRLELNEGQLQQIKEIEGFDYMIVPSNFVKSSFVAEGFDPDKIYLLPFATNVKKFRHAPELKPQDGKFRVICVAQISLRKGHIDLLKAWEMADLPNAELIFVGSLTMEMEEMFKKYRDKVKYLGILPHEELYKYYNQADAFVLPSLEEGCSYVPLEAMSCGTPVIVTTNTGSGELVEHGKEGFVVPIRSPEKIAEHLRFLHDNPEARQEMSAAALQKASQDFGWENYSKKLIGIYQDIYSRHSG